MDAINWPRVRNAIRKRCRQRCRLGILPYALLDDATQEACCIAIEAIHEGMDIGLAVWMSARKGSSAALDAHRCHAPATHTERWQDADYRGTQWYLEHGARGAGQATLRGSW